MSDAFPAVRRTTIVNRKGLHARASAKVAKLAGEYDAQVFVGIDGNGTRSPQPSNHVLRGGDEFVCKLAMADDDDADHLPSGQ